MQTTDNTILITGGGSGPEGTGEYKVLAETDSTRALEAVRPSQARSSEALHSARTLLF